MTKELYEMLTKALQSIKYGKIIIYVHNGDVKKIETESKNIVTN